MTDTVNQEPSSRDQGDLIANRREKLTRWRQAGVEPYPHHFARTHLSAEVVASHETLVGQTVTVAGRIVAWRPHGKSTFFHILDDQGKIQCYGKADQLGPELYERLGWMDIGDYIGVTGEVFLTRTGEVTVGVRSFTLLSKALRPLPEKWHGLVDKELRYRRRYLDLISNPEVRQLFVVRARILSRVRSFLDERGFLEVETPVLQPIYGGAAARPFITHHNALDVDLYLRIADELYLKRLIVGGYEKVYEVCRDFRNEGIDRDHNPEFTMVELYVAYADFRDIMNLFQELLVDVATTVNGKPSFLHDGAEVDMSGSWREIPMLDSIREATGLDLGNPDAAAARAGAKSVGVAIPDDASYAKVVDEVFSQRVQPGLIAPTFIIDYPVEMSPLAKRHRSKPGFVERFELFMAGREVGNAFTELNDPDDQRARFEAMAEAVRQGDFEAHRVDEDFLQALEHGMPPTGGLGFGIDRLVMTLTGVTSIREVILFPTLRPPRPDSNPPAPDEP